MSGGEVDEIAKWALRRRVLAARRAVPVTVREAEAAALAATLLHQYHWFDPASRSQPQGFDPASRSQPQGFDPASRSQPQGFDPANRSHALALPGTVCAYWPVGAEPGSPALLDGLARHGCQVLLPVVSTPAGPPGPLDWAEYTGPESLRAGVLGLREPTGPRLGRTAIATAVLVLVPALAVDRHGARLGRGSGYYDRTLPLAAPGTPLVAIVRDDEVFASLPVQPHDVPVTAALTPGRGLLPLGPL